MTEEDGSQCALSQPVKVNSVLLISSARAYSLANSNSCRVMKESIANSSEALSGDHTTR